MRPDIMDTKITIHETEEYKDWYLSLSDKKKLQIAGRLDRIEKHGHFGHVESLDEKLFELKWKNGLRIYFIRTAKATIVLLLGGLKNAQEKDIKKARLLLR